MSFKPLTPSDLFQCKNCGQCCKGYGGTFVTPEDIQAISDYIRTDPERFVSDYCQKSGRKPVLTQNPDGYCIFWDKACTIHPVKPRMCKAWPFIKPVLKDIKNWEVMSQFCPGIRTDVQVNLIKKIVEKEILQST